MSTWQEDARWVGTFVRGGSWECGLRIARRVEIGKGNGVRGPGGGKKASSIEEAFDRVSVVAFAREAGIAESTVRRYLSAWEWAAADGLVDSSSLRIHLADRVNGGFSH